jgi:mono/diheme cytochrome c family protein
MVGLAEPRIGPAEAEQILFFLTQTYVPKPFQGPATASLVEQHCMPCHSAKDIFSTSRGRDTWIQIVKQMNEYDPDIVPGDQIDAIVEYIMKQQQGSG